jgi:hypothetical protein
MIECYVHVVLCRYILFYCLHEEKESYIGRRVSGRCEVLVYTPSITPFSGLNRLLLCCCEECLFLFFFFFLSCSLAVEGTVAQDVYNFYVELCQNDFSTNTYKVPMTKFVW